MTQRRAGSYLLIKILGEGGFGTTYQAETSSTGEEFAIKEFFPADLCERISDETGYHIRVRHNKKTLFQKELNRFRKEAEALKKCAGLQSIAKYADYFEDNGTAYIVMEHIEGITLETYIKENGALDFEEMLSLFDPLLKDLQQVHAIGLVHCDISPDNIVIGLDNSIHLIDFGIANSYLTDARHRTIILKNGFAAPEQYSPSGKTGPWTDVYGISATIYFTLTGQPPAPSKERGNDAESRLLENLKKIRPWQKAALLKGMSQSISSRFSDMETFHQALVRRDVIGKLKTAHTRSDTRYRRAGLGAAIAAVLVIIAALGISSRIKDSQNHHDTVAGTLPEKTSAASSPSAVPSAEPSSKILSMPELTGMKLAAARETLSALDKNIVIRTIKIARNKTTKNTVIRQSIPEGFSFEKGQIKEILLVISKAPEPKTNPSSRAQSEAHGSPAQSRSTENTSGDKIQNSPVHSSPDQFTVYGEDDYTDLDLWKND